MELHLHVTGDLTLHLYGNDPGLVGMLTSIRDGVAALHTQGAAIMATEQELESALQRIDTTTTALADLSGKILTNERNQIDEIKRLQELVGAGQPVTQSQLDALVTNANARAAALEALQATLAPLGADLNPPPAPPVDVPPGGTGEGGGTGTGEGGGTGEGTGGGTTEPPTDPQTGV